MLALDDAAPLHICWSARQLAEEALKAALVLERARGCPDRPWRRMRAGR